MAIQEYIGEGIWIAWHVLMIELLISYGLDANVISIKRNVTTHL